MRILTWNLNHRAARRPIPPWVHTAVGNVQPDIAVLTEYVEGPDHERFLRELAAVGLSHVCWSQPTKGHNQILIASQAGLTRGHLRGPDIHPAVPSNALHVRSDHYDLDVLGFRMPAFPARDHVTKLKVWDWLIEASRSLERRSTVLTGDLNTAVGDKASGGGEALLRLPKAGWQHAIPSDGFSWKSARHGTTRRIDHTFLSPPIAAASSRYSWDFQALSPKAASGDVGIPDHAMLITDW